jgi:hypothetical protein
MPDLGKHAFTEAFERERMDAPQHLPVGFRNGGWHGADSVVIEAEREWHRRVGLFRFAPGSSCQQVSGTAR